MATKKAAVAKTAPIDDKEARKKALSTALAQLERDFGTGTVMKLGENTHMEVQAVSTGSLSLDAVPFPMAITSILYLSTIFFITFAASSVLNLLLVVG